MRSRRWRGRHKLALVGVGQGHEADLGDRVRTASVSFRSPKLSEAGGQRVRRVEQVAALDERDKGSCSRVAITVHVTGDSMSVRGLQRVRLQHPLTLSLSKPEPRR